MTMTLHPSECACVCCVLQVWGGIFTLCVHITSRKKCYNNDPSPPQSLHVCVVFYRSGGSVHSLCSGDLQEEML